MFKSICFLSIIIAVANAGDYTFQVTNAKVFPEKDTNDYLDAPRVKGNINSITWKVDVDETMPVEVDFVMYQFINDERESKPINLPDLCGSYDDDQDKKSLQEFVLMALGGSESCPISKDTKVQIKKKFTVPFATSGSETCVPLFAIINLKDKTQQIPIVEYRFEANLKGKSCEE